MDLSDDLANFDDDHHKFRRELDFDELLPRISDRPEPRRLGSLADLERGGFNTTSYTAEWFATMSKMFDDATASMGGLMSTISEVTESLNALMAQVDPPPEPEEK